MTIDLSQFVGKKVRVTLRGGLVKELTIKKGNSSFYPYITPENGGMYNINGQNNTGVEGYEDIIHIEEIKTVTKTVDLSKYLNKEVLVTRRNGDTLKGKVEKNTLDNRNTHPIRITGCGTYTTDGIWSVNYQRDASTLDIVKVEEIQVKKYQELEKKVAEMQKEIDRLKAQEQKEVRSFRNDIKRVLSQFYASAEHYDDGDELDNHFTNKICEVVERYIPVSYDANGNNYDWGYNDALFKVKKNLGLDK